MGLEERDRERMDVTSVAKLCPLARPLSSVAFSGGEVDIRLP